MVNRIWDSEDGDVSIRESGETLTRERTTYDGPPAPPAHGAAAGCGGAAAFGLRTGSLNRKGVSAAPAQSCHSGRHLCVVAGHVQRIPGRLQTEVVTAAPGPAGVRQPRLFLLPASRWDRVVVCRLPRHEVLRDTAESAVGMPT